jgi:dipeptidyl aminopeptidase/acylaminoacyl peptidase
MDDGGWQRRYTAPSIAGVSWAQAEPGRLGIVSNESGRWQAWSWDLSTGERRVASTSGVGAEEVHVLPDGSGVVWWHDALGDERGRWMVTPFGGGEPQPLLEEVPDGWMMGISIAGDLAAVGLSTDENYRVFVGSVGSPARELYRSERPAGVGRGYPQGTGGLSADARLLCIRHGEAADIRHPGLRVLDAGSGATVGDQLDPGMWVDPVAWSPIEGDQRLAFVQERSGIERPAIWDLATGNRTDLLLGDLAGPVEPVDWFPDGSALVIRHEREGRHRLLRVEPVHGDATEVVAEIDGTISAGGFRPDGTLWLRTASSRRPPAINDVDGAPVLELPVEPAPDGRPMRPIAFSNPHSETIHGFVIVPEGPPPYPTIVSVHGGPESHHTDDFDADALAYADNGFAVLLVNYRGSTGYGRAHREALAGNIGFPESEDVIAALDHVITDGVADPARVFLEGWSWGGYLAMLNAGLNPERWQAVAAGIPTGDSVAAHYECAPSLRAWDLAVMGGSPMELPELYRERNPMTYVDRVRAPMLVIAGENDSRCPLGSVMIYAHALRVRGKAVEVHTQAGGHHANDVTERIRHIELIVDFFRRNA